MKFLGNVQSNMMVHMLGNLVDGFFKVGKAYTSTSCSTIGNDRCEHLHPKNAPEPECSPPPIKQHASSASVLGLILQKGMEQAPFLSEFDICAHSFTQHPFGAIRI